MSRKLPTYLEPEEFKKLLANTKRTDHKIAFLLGFGSGMRLSEIVGLEDKIQPVTKECFNFEKKTITIKGGKGGVDRIVPIPKGFKDSMLSYLPVNKKYKTVASARRSLQRIFMINTRKANLLEKKPGLHFHSLRHSFGSRLANQGMPIHHIRTLMGHTNISTTNIYLIANPTKALEDYEKYF